MLEDGSEGSAQSGLPVQGHLSGQRARALEQSESGIFGEDFVQTVDHEQGPGLGFAQKKIGRASCRERV